MKKRNIFNKIITVAFALFLTFNVVACGSGKGSNVDSGVIETTATRGTHKVKVAETSIDLFKDGLSAFTIVYPNGQYAGDISTAVMELQSLIYDATNVYLPIKADTEKTDVTNILSVGKTAQALSNSAVQNKLATENLQREGYILYSQDSAVYMLGSSAKSALFACYEFLKWQFNFEFYANDEWSLLKNVKDMKLKSFDIVDVPDFMTRIPQNGEAITLGITTRNRFRISGSDGELFNNHDGNSWCDNFFELIPKSKYGEHSNWFATDGRQLCLTARGDEEDLQELKDTVVSEMIYRLAAQPDKDWIAFSMEDGGWWCECDECEKEYGLYDTENTAAFAVYIRFVNYVAKEVKKWNVENCPERDIIIFIYNYGKCRWAPVKLDENKNPIKDKDGNYMPYSDDLIIEDNVGVVFCAGVNTATYYDMDYELNLPTVEQAERLRAIMKRPTFYMWHYSSYFTDYFVPNPNVHTRQNHYQWAYDLGCVALMDQAAWTTGATTDWGALKTYVSSKLTFNVSLNVGELINNFFDNYYKSASGVMKAMFDDYNNYLAYLAETRGHKGNKASVNVHLDAKNWPYERVQKFLSYIGQAYEVISPMKDLDPITYQKLYDRITKESITYRYMLILMHSSYYSYDTLVEMKTTFKNDCLRLGIDQYMEHGSISNLFV